MKLKELQHAFIRSMTEGDPKLNEWIADGRAMSAEERLAVYSGNMRMSLYRALEQIYPVCLRILGKDYFKQISRGYNERYPSQLTDLNGHGEHLCDLFEALIKAREELAEYPYLMDLAQLEYHYHRVYYDKDDTPFDYAAFAQHAQVPQALHFELPQAMALMTSVYPLLKIWEVNQSDEKKVPEVSADTVREYLCVRRNKGRPCIERIDRERYAVLDSIAQGWSLERLAEAYQTLDTELPQLIQEGWVESFRVA